MFGPGSCEQDHNCCSHRGGSPCSVVSAPLACESKSPSYNLANILKKNQTTTFSNVFSSMDFDLLEQVENGQQSFGAWGQQSFHSVQQLISSSL